MTDDRDPIEAGMRRFTIPPSARQRSAVLSAYDEGPAGRRSRGRRWVVGFALAASVLLAFQFGRWVEGRANGDVVADDTPIAIDELAWNRVPADGLAARVESP